jgi:hypothetical protein
MRKGLGPDNRTAFDDWTHVGPKDLVVSETSTSYYFKKFIAVLLGLLFGAALLRFLAWLMYKLIPYAMKQFGTVVKGIGTHHASYAQGGVAATLQKGYSWLGSFF